MFGILEGEHYVEFSWFRPRLNSWKVGLFLLWC